jgi:hypothetical protein
MNKNLQIPGGSITCASANLGNISQSELNCLNNCTVNIQTELNVLSNEIDNLQTSTSGNSTSLTGISYNAGTDTTLIDNNLTISSGKILLIGTANVMNLIDSNANDIIALNQRTSGITYNSAADRTTIDNNVTINKTLIVQGMDIKAEIDALDSTITTGNIDTTNLTTNNLTVELDSRFGNNGGHTFIKGPLYLCDITTQDETNYTQFYQQSDVFGETTFKIEQNTSGSNISFGVRNIDDELVETMNISSTAVGINAFLNVYNNTIINGDFTCNGGTADFNCSVRLNEQVQCFLSVAMYNGLSVDGTCNLNATNMKTTSITTSNGQTSNGSLTIVDNGGSTNRTLSIVPNSNSGAFNPTVQSGDISFVALGTSNGVNGNLNISTWSNTRNGVRVTSNSTTISGGNNNIQVNPSGTTIEGKTHVKGNFISRNMTAGYMVDGNNNDVGTQFYPIICSTKRYRPANVDDFYIINPGTGYRFTIYYNDDYGYVLKDLVYEFANNTDTVQIYECPKIGTYEYDKMNSIKVEYSEDGGLNYTEVLLTGVS